MTRRTRPDLNDVNRSERPYARARASRVAAVVGTVPVLPSEAPAVVVRPRRRRAPQLSARERDLFVLLGGRLRKLRGKRSIAECAALAGVSKRAWEYFEGGVTVPTYPWLRRVFGVFGQSVALRIAPIARGVKSPTGAEDCAVMRNVERGQVVSGGGGE